MKKEPSTIKIAYVLAKKYFMQSNERLIAWLLLLLSLLGILGTVAITGLLSWYSVGLWAALIAKNLPAFISCLKWFSLSLAGLITGIMVKDISSTLLSLRLQALHYYLKTRYQSISLAKFQQHLVKFN